jgi:hypothetical protein
MEWHFIVALLLAVPLIMLPVAYVWYLNIGGFYSWIKGREVRREEVSKVAESTRKRKYGVKPGS